ncbi:hypothetical protein [Pseudomonas sp. CC120222-01a]|uniref:hypothetical protein n=1 Tax=Pseudomonas sp. CC120222-01a TaxID=1378075 RepID=UPI000D8AA119|nr:hypothetical protein [Pseudomonas sp. CC120222-01a]PVZ42559.1 hypothetical protein N430_01172 [Pseudomonas sp. CC120222-01a]
MANFTVRVELHDAREHHYETLHSEMEKRGFEKTIEGNDAIFELPPGEYNIIRTATRTEILDLADAAIKVTGRKSAVLVTEGSRTWRRLDKA